MKNKSFIEDNEQIWKSIFKLKDRLRRLEKLEKTIYWLTCLHHIIIIGLIVSQIILYGRYF